MSDWDEARRAEEAQHLLNHPLVKEAFQSIKDGIVDSISRSAMGDADTHNRLAIALQILRQVEKQFIDHIETGKMVSLQVQDSFLKKVF